MYRCLPALIVVSVCSTTSVFFGRFIGFKCLDRETITCGDHSWLMPSFDRHSDRQSSTNKFVEATLVYALSYVSSLQTTMLGSSLFTIWADKDYYSTPGMPKGRFVDFKVPLHEANKTGLGSSAALVTALTAATLAYYLRPNIFSLASENGRTRLHNLAQAAHCSAQGKVGSGFDVAAAAYGSCIYRRFSPKILEEIGEPGASGFSTRLRAVTDDTSSNQKWDASIDAAAAIVPKGLLLVMCDVDCGSETVGMVKKVLNWRKERPEEATQLWTNLQRANEDLGQRLRSIASSPTSSEISSLRAIILTIRSLIRQMSVKAGVPIEPPAQTALIDACSDLPGIIGGTVPGAGGYDAVALLVEDKEEVLSRLNDFLARYPSEANENDGRGIGKVRLLGVKQEHEGVRTEYVPAQSAPAGM